MKKHTDKNQHTAPRRTVAEYDKKPYRIVKINANQATIANAKGKW